VKIWEGGKADRPKTADHGGPTNKGMTQKTLEKHKSEYGDLPEHSHDLTDAQIDGLYYEKYFRRQNLDAVAAAIPDIMEKAPKLLGALINMGVIHGPERAVRRLQSALDEVTKSDLKVKGEYTGNILNKTLDALKDADAAGKLDAVTNRLVDKWFVLMNSSDVKADNYRGWERRANSFRP
jgi:lysozyme family protein